MRYTVLQLQFTDEDYVQINSMENPHNDHPKFAVKMQAQIGKLTMGQIAKFYEPVAEIEAADLEDVFHISNSGLCEEQITRLLPMHAISVGDVIIDGRAHKHLVATVGFIPLADV